MFLKNGLPLRKGTQPVNRIQAATGAILVVTVTGNFPGGELDDFCIFFFFLLSSTFLGGFGNWGGVHCLSPGQFVYFVQYHA